MKITIKGTKKNMSEKHAPTDQKIMKRVLGRKEPMETGGRLAGYDGKLKWFWRQGQGLFVHRNVNPILMITWVDDVPRYDTLDYTIQLTPKQLDTIHHYLIDCMEAERDELTGIRELVKIFVDNKIKHAITDRNDPEGFFSSSKYAALVKECIAKVRAAMEMDGPVWDPAFVNDGRSSLGMYKEEIEATIMNALKRYFNVPYDIQRGDE